MPPSKYQATPHFRNSVVFWEAKESQVYIPRSPIHRSLHPCPSTAQRWSWPSPQRSSCLQVSPVFGLFGHEGLGSRREEPSGECQRHSLIGTQPADTHKLLAQVHTSTCAHVHRRTPASVLFIHLFILEVCAELVLCPTHQAGS